MISELEITKSKEVPGNLRDNLNILLERANKLRTLWNQPMTITSGWRTIEEHIAIYAKKGITDRSKIPMQSKHLYCQAIDIFDKDGELKRFVKANNYKILIDCELWMEAEESTPNWLHVQILPPHSNLREFNP
jgi:Peptidase M15